MRRGYFAAFGLAVLLAVLSGFVSLFFWSFRYLPEEPVERALEQARAEAEAAGFRPFDERVIEEFRLPSAVDSPVRGRVRVEHDRCLLVLAGMHGERRVRGVDFHTDAGARLAHPADRIVAQAVHCNTSARAREVSWHLISEAVDDVRADRKVHFYLMAGSPDLELPSLAAPDEASVTRYSYRPAVVVGASVFIAALFVGLVIARALRSRRELWSEARSLRRLTLILPSVTRGEIEHLAERAGSAGSAKARREGISVLRDALVALAPAAKAACWQHWRAGCDDIAAREPDLVREVTREVTAAASYREASEGGFFALSIVWRHRCELPEWPSVLDPESLVIALESSVPWLDDELEAVSTRLCPVDPALRLDLETLEARFPELQPMGAMGLRRCSRCEALGSDPARCDACGEVRASDERVADVA